MNRNQCSTIGCHADATHTLAFTFQGSRDRVETDPVCESCGAAYSRRPSLQAIMLPGLVSVTYAEYRDLTSVLRARQALAEHSEVFCALV